MKLSYDEKAFIEHMRRFEAVRVDERGQCAVTETPSRGSVVQGCLGPRVYARMQLLVDSGEGVSDSADYFSPGMVQSVGKLIPLPAYEFFFKAGDDRTLHFHFKMPLRPGP